MLVVVSRFLVRDFEDGDVKVSEYEVGGELTDVVLYVD